MKSSFLIGIFLFIGFMGFGQVSKNLAQTPDPNKEVMKVQASCGECQFGLTGYSCDLAIKIDGKSYFVDGAKIDEFGNPHGKNGFCVAVRNAEVQGEIVDGRFQASYFNLLPADKKNSRKK